MKHPFDYILGINVADLAVVIGLEHWRPGLVSQALDLSLLWVVAAIAVGLAWVWRRD